MKLNSKDITHRHLKDIREVFNKELQSFKDEKLGKIDSFYIYVNGKPSVVSQYTTEDIEALLVCFISCVNKFKDVYVCVGVNYSGMLSRDILIVNDGD